MQNFNKIIEEICEELGIKYQYLADKWIYHLEYKNKNRYIAGYKFDLNPQGLGYILDDKYAFYELITKKGFKSTKYHLIYQNYNQHMIKELFNKYHQEVVIKSNNGTCGEEVFYVNNEEKLFQIISEVLKRNTLAVICPFYKIKTEYRVILVDSSVKLTYAKKRPVVIGDGKSTIKELLIKFNEHYFKNKELTKDYDRVLNSGVEYSYGWQFNLSQGAIIDNVEDVINEKIKDIAINISKSIGLRFGSIDIIETEENKFLVMEGNSGVMMDNFISLNKNGYKLAKDIYKEVIIKMFE